MPQYVAPNSDISRLTYMNRAIRTAASAQTAGEQILDAALLADLTAHYTAYRVAYDEVEASLSRRKNETAESEAAVTRLEMYVNHIWTAVKNRARRENHPVGVLGYYKLNADSSRPTPSGRDQWAEMAVSIINGDATAVADGFPPIACPSAAELQLVLDNAQSERDDIPMADKKYDNAQAAVAALRPRADELIRDVRDVVQFAVRKMDAPSQRRTLRNYGARYYYLPSEQVDDGDETAVGATSAA